MMNRWAAGERRSRTCAATLPRPALPPSNDPSTRGRVEPGHSLRTDVTALRLGAVSYLNTKPLVYGLDAHPEQFDVRFDVPSNCAALLHEGKVDLGLIPAIEYQRGDY